MNTILAIALGGAAGALGRYGVSRLFTDLVHASMQPVATLAVNVIGCGIMGVCFGLMLAGAFNLGDAGRGFLLIGFLGALTTFSSFSLDAFRLMEQGGYGLAFIYVAGSVILSLAAFFAGASLIRLMLGGN